MPNYIKMGLYGGFLAISFETGLDLFLCEAPRACLPTGRHSAGLPGNELLFLYCAH